MTHKSTDMRRRTDDPRTAITPPDIADETFRHAMSLFGSGVTVVTTGDCSGAQSGFTASSFTSLSRKPPLILVCLARSANSYRHFVEAEEFGVSILHGGQADIARLFASRGADKFAGDHIERTANGLPLIRDALVALECKMESVTAGGDHVILIGRPVAVKVSEGKPLLTFFSQLHAWDGANTNH